MLRNFPYDTLGHANHGWLDARHHFSFANYRNSDRMGFGALRVINDDVIAPGSGFDTHPHRDMEIITYVRKGAITHQDSRGNKGRTAAGDLQVMSAGSGILHSEFNLESEETSIFQIWIFPKRRGIEPKWDSLAFPKEPANDALPLLVSGDGVAPLQINQDAWIYGGRLSAGTRLEHKVHTQAYIVVSDGEVEVDGKLLRRGDGAEVVGVDHFTIDAKTDAELLVIDVPKMGED